ncbi:MAG: ankyrin repeat domain-containing protein [Chloroflexia bacterium]
MNTDNLPITQEMKDGFVGVCHGDFAKVKEMIEARPELVNSVATWGETPIEAAAQTSSRAICELLLDHGAPLEICTAASLGMNDKVKEMLDADPTLKDAQGAHGIPLMYYPTITDNVELAELLLNRGTDIDAGAGGNTALHGAAMMGQTRMTEWLLSHGANPNATDYEGKTPLQRALEYNQQGVASALQADVEK